jgi:hypothetical protein
VSAVLRINKYISMSEKSKSINQYIILIAFNEKNKIAMIDRMIENMTSIPGGRGNICIYQDSLVLFQISLI